MGAFQIPATVWVHLIHSVAACYCVGAVGAPYCYAVLWVHYKFLLLWVYFQCLVPPCYFNVWLPPAMLLWVHFKLLPTIQLENELGKQYKSLDGSKIYLPRDKWLFTLLTINCQNPFLPQQ